MEILSSTIKILQKFTSKYGIRGPAEQIYAQSQSKVIIYSFLTVTKSTSKASEFTYAKKKKSCLQGGKKCYPDLKHSC